jgi:hypothetical protein
MVAVEDETDRRGSSLSDVVPLEKEVDLRPSCAVLLRSFVHFALQPTLQMAR